MDYKIEELLIKSECISDSINGSDPTFLSEKFALYARYSFDSFGKTFNEVVFITYLFESKEIIDTGKTTITEFKDIDSLTQEDIVNSVEDDMEVKVNRITGDNSVNQKLNSIIHNKNLPYPISDGREKVYKILKG